MAATVKPIEAKAVHQIQSGQVIVDLCSVVKELVENSLDAGATAIEVRFKQNGLDEIEVQDNGSGLAAANYENVALKHYTSKLSSYDDLDKLETFGFRGEALASLCALSNFTITTAQANEVPKGSRLEFETSGKLKSTTIVACQKGVTATVQNLFEKLPVRRKELSKNIKREYGKVVGLLHAYACISTNVKFTAKNTVAKGKSMTVFATQANATTRDNIANVYGAKTLSALVPLDLHLDFQPETSLSGRAKDNSSKVVVKGHISKPVFGEGRQTPDRQMFFVNGRPCGLPQIAKAINEVYKSFNVSQSPFIFADLEMDTSAYDVNVSPDKRSILLHNAAVMIEALKVELTSMFDDQDHTVPQSLFQTPKLPSYKQLDIRRTESIDSKRSFVSRGSKERESGGTEQETYDESSPIRDHRQSTALLDEQFRDIASSRKESRPEANQDKQIFNQTGEQQVREITEVVDQQSRKFDRSEDNNHHGLSAHKAQRYAMSVSQSQPEDIPVRDFNARMAENDQHKVVGDEIGQRHERRAKPELRTVRLLPSMDQTGVVPSAFDRMRPKRIQPEIATITVAGKTVTRVIGSGSLHGDQNEDLHSASPAERRKHGISPRQSALAKQFSRRLDAFSAPGTQAQRELERIEDDLPQGLDSNTHAYDEMSDDSSQNSHASHEQDPDEPDNKFGATAASTKHPGDQSVMSDEDFVNESEQKVNEQQRVAELIHLAETAAVRPSELRSKRAQQALKGRSKDSTVNLEVSVDAAVDSVETRIRLYRRGLSRYGEGQVKGQHEDSGDEGTDEERLSLTVSKSDFAKMQVVGQFNLGFVLAVRPKQTDLSPADTTGRSRDELFIIDQHASDEKYNFERLQEETVVGSQRMVRSVTLDLTAVEEEVLIESHEALEKNGFVVDIDLSGDRAVGQRCQLISLPLNKEVVFNTRDLDELIHLLQESPMISGSRLVPRPSKVRKMFAMRACRSSIMIGKTLTQRQMYNILHHMGSIDKPWNCPHGRPTMRHLASLDAFEETLWREGDGLETGSDTGQSTVSMSAADVWSKYGVG